MPKYFRITDQFQSCIPWETENYQGWVDEEVYSNLSDHQQRNPEILFKVSNQEIVRDKRNLIINKSIGNENVWIKQFRPNGTVDRLIYSAKPGKAVYAWNAGLALLERSILTPRPLIGLRGKGLYGGSRGILATEDLSHSWNLEKMLTNTEEGEEKNRTLHQLGEFVGKFHDQGFRHRDLRKGNILVSNSEEGIKFYLIDLNRLRLQSPLNFIQRLREVERLNLEEDEAHVFFEGYLPNENTKNMVKRYRQWVNHSHGLEHLPMGKLRKKLWYYGWELRTYSSSRRP